MRGVGGAMLSVDRAVDGRPLPSSWLPPIPASKNRPAALSLSSRSRSSSSSSVTPRSKVPSDRDPRGLEHGLEHGEPSPPSPPDNERDRDRDRDRDRELFGAARGVMNESPPPRPADATSGVSADGERRIAGTTTRASARAGRRGAGEGPKLWTRFATKSMKCDKVILGSLWLFGAMQEFRRNSMWEGFFCGGVRLLGPLNTRFLKKFFFFFFFFFLIFF
jgi:hypothetical protein